MNKELDEDYVEILGDLDLRQILMKKDKSKRLLPIIPDSNFKISWDMIGIVFIIY